MTFSTPKQTAKTCFSCLVNPRAIPVNNSMIHAALRYLDVGEVSLDVLDLGNFLDHLAASMGLEYVTNRTVHDFLGDCYAAALLAADPADEDRVRPIGIDIGRLISSGLSLAVGLGRLFL